jgi:hypothetical protein
MALLPYGLALLCWQGVTLALYLLAVRAIVSAASSSAAPTRPATDVSGWWLLFALAYPAVFVNLGHGQNGFLSAALLGGALAMLDRRPLLAGILIGLLAYKPQLGMLFPLVLAASGRWRTFAAAALTVTLLVFATWMTFGTEVWEAFLASTHFTRVVLLENGDVGWHKIQSVFSWVRMWGGSIPLAYAIQAAVSLPVAVTLVWLWRSGAAFALQAAALCLAIALVSPFSLDYDMLVLAPALAFLAMHGFHHGFAPYEKSLLAALWLVPLVARGLAEVTFVPLGVPLMLAAFLLVLRKAGMLATAGPSAVKLF